jgi:cyclic beta-1,2-glucan synthetase
MLSAAYAMLGLEFVDGELRPRPDAFEAKGELRLESVSYRDKVFTRDPRRGHGRVPAGLRERRDTL